MLEKKSVEKIEPSYIFAGTINWYSRHLEQYGGSSKQLK